MTISTIKPNSLGGVPSFSAYQSSSQTISTSTLTVLSTDIEEFDTASCFNNTGSTVGSIPAYSFLPTVAGYYQVTGQVSFGSGITGVVFSTIYKNGSRFLDGSFSYYSSVAGDVVSSTVTGLVYLNGTTDYITLYVDQTSGSSKTTFTGVRASRFQADFVRGV